MKTRFLKYIISLLILTGFFAGGDRALGQSMTLAQVTGGLTSTSTNLNSSMTQIPLFGFGVTVSGTIAFTKFIVPTGFTANTYLANVKLYRNATNTYPSSPQLVGTATLTATGIDVNFSTAETITNTTSYYFVVADIAYSSNSTDYSAPFRFVYGSTFGETATTSYPAHSSDSRAYVFDPPPPPTIAYANNTTGYTPASTLYYGSTGIVLHAVTLTPTGNAYTIKSAKITYTTSKTTPFGFFPSADLQLWLSTTGSYANKTQITGASFGQSGADITVSIGDFTLTPGTAYTFYLVAGLTSGAASMPSAFSIDFTKIFSTSPAITYTNSSTSESYTLSSGTVTTADNNFVANGITANTSLAYGQTGVVVFSFAATVTGNMTITKMNVPSSISMGPYFTNGTLYRSPDQYFTHATAVSGAVVDFNTGFTGAAISSLSETFASLTPVTYYYFIVGDLNKSIGFPTPATVKFTLPTSQTPAVFTNSNTNTYAATTLINGQTFNIVSNYDWVSTSSTSFITLTNFNPFNSGSAATSLPSSAISVYIGRKTAGTVAPILPNSTSIGAVTFSNAAISNPTISLASGTITINGINVLSGVNATINGPASGTATLVLPSGSLSTIASTGTLTLGNNVVIANSGTFTIKSDASSTGAIAAIPSSSSITGAINVERWITGGAGTTYRGYRLLSSPVNISNSSTGTGYIDLGYLNSNSNSVGALTGGPGGTSKGFSVTLATPALYFFREDVVASSSSPNAGKNKGVTGIYSTGTTSSVDIATGTNLVSSTNFQIPVGNGYIFYNIGSSAQTSNTASNSSPASYAITAKGYLNQGTITFKNWYTGASTLSYTSSLGTSNKGFNMVGNPYASTLDLNAFYTDNSSVIQPNIYVLNNINPGQAYISYNASNGNVSDPHASRYIASGQGMFVQAQSASALTFKESQKAPATQLTGTNLLMGKPVKEAAIAGFFMKVEQDSLINDYCGIYFDGGSDDFDADDAVDLDGASPKVYMSSYTSDGQRTAINAFSDYKNGKTIKLYVNATTTGLYKLKIEQIKNIDATYDIWLKDNFKHDSLDLRSNSTYSFNIVRTDATSFGADRFQVVIRKKSLPAYKFVSLTGTATPSGVSLTWKTQNEYDFTGFTVERLNANKDYDPLYYMQSDGSGTYNFIDKNPSLGVNTYRIKQDDFDNNITYSADVTVNTSTPNIANSNIIVYPSPATSLINVKFANPLTGAANVIVVNAMGDIVNKQVFTQQQDSMDVSKLKTGVYFIRTTDVNTQKEIGSQRFIKL